MRFEPNTIYHIYNQGNNREPIFFQERNYPFFLGKMKKHLSPFGDLICYCLMPNHFHWLFYTNAKACEPIDRLRKSSDDSSRQPSDGFPRETTSQSSDDFSRETTRQSSDDFPKQSSSDDLPQQRLSRAIGTLLSSYSRAINNQENRTGSLFRPKTKAKDGWIDNFITVDGKHREMFFRPDNDYAFQCFKYIHQNPVEARLVQNPEDWPYSSAGEYAGKRKAGICNVELGRKILGL